MNISEIVELQYFFDLEPDEDFKINLDKYLNNVILYRFESQTPFVYSFNPVFNAPIFRNAVKEGDIFIAAGKSFTDLTSELVFKTLVNEPESMVGKIKVFSAPNRTFLPRFDFLQPIIIRSPMIRPYFIPPYRRLPFRRFGGGRRFIGPGPGFGRFGGGGRRFIGPGPGFGRFGGGGRRFIGPGSGRFGGGFRGGMGRGFRGR